MCTLNAHGRARLISEPGFGCLVPPARYRDIMTWIHSSSALAGK
uniref:Uncharacterized protein n=1 Tax=Anguilla anguilla TaxID=7936 RepID=A0A0E9QXW5_ANGAN